MAYCSMHMGRENFVIKALHVLMDHFNQVLVYALELS